MDFSLCRKIRDHTESTCFCLARSKSQGCEIVQQPRASACSGCHMHVCLPSLAAFCTFEYCAGDGGMRLSDSERSLWFACFRSRNLGSSGKTIYELCPLVSLTWWPWVSRVRRKMVALREHANGWRNRSCAPIENLSRLEQHGGKVTVHKDRDSRTKRIQAHIRSHLSDTSSSMTPRNP